MIITKNTKGTTMTQEVTRTINENDYTTHFIILVSLPIFSALHMSFENVCFFFPPCSYLIGGKFHVHNTNMSKCNLTALLSTLADDVTVSCSYHSMNFENEASRLHPRHPCWWINGYMIKNKITKEKVCKEQSKSCQWQVLIFSRQS